MFNSLASYLLGVMAPASQQSASQPDEEREAEVGYDNYDCADCYDDWVLVEERSDWGAGAAEPVERTRRSPSPRGSLPRSRSCSPCSDTIEETWYITPPPCFTSTGPVNIVTSPLENMLIEHPSMSVYCHTSASSGSQLTRPTSTGSVFTTLTDHPEKPFTNRRAAGPITFERWNRDCVPVESATSRRRRPRHQRQDIQVDCFGDVSGFDDVTDSMVVVPDVIVEKTKVIRRRRKPRTAGRREATQRPVVVVAQGPVNREQLDPVARRKDRDINIRTQKLQVRSENQILNKANLERHNKAREVNCRNQHQRRGEKSQGARRSGANNNRKC